MDENTESSVLYDKPGSQWSVADHLGDADHLPGCLILQQPRSDQS